MAFLSFFLSFLSFLLLPSIMNTCSKGRAIKRASRVTGWAERLEEVTDPQAGTEAWDDLQEKEILVCWLHCFHQYIWSDQTAEQTSQFYCSVTPVGLSCKFTEYFRTVDANGKRPNY